MSGVIKLLACSCNIESRIDRKDKASTLSSDSALTKGLPKLEKRMPLRARYGGAHLGSSPSFR